MLNLSFSFLVGITNHLLPEILPSSGSCISVFALPKQITTHFEAHPIMLFFFIRSFKGLPLHIWKKPQSSPRHKVQQKIVLPIPPTFSWALSSSICPLSSGAFPMLSFLLKYCPSKPSLELNSHHHLRISLSITFPESPSLNTEFEVHLCHSVLQHFRTLFSFPILNV